jgi:hypothetical protein
VPAVPSHAADIAVGVEPSASVASWEGTSVVVARRPAAGPVEAAPAHVGAWGDVRDAMLVVVVATS